MRISIPLRLVAFVLLGLALALARSAPAAEVAKPGPAWLSDDSAAFAQARASGRYVLLYLEAVWCHWCHVMDHETYASAGVQATLARHYVPLRIDQDSRPDLANRYRDYGWPATVVFAPDGSEIVKRRGYIAPEAFRRLLEAIVADPSPERVASLADTTSHRSSSLTDATRAELGRGHRDSHDDERGGLDTNQKFLDRDSVEYALVLGLAGDATQLARARQTLDGALALIDPVWGGVYQYSTHGDWRHPHYEKLAVLQGEYLRLYALAYAATGEARYRAAAEAILRYLEAFLASPDGAYYASQDADVVRGEHAGDYYALDDAGRRRIGVPRVDRNTYARETGTIAAGLLAWSDASGDIARRDRALAALDWALAERALDGGGYAHGADDPAGPYLGDSLAMGRALLAAYRSTGERRWLAQASAAARFIERKFRAASGYASAAPGPSPIAPVPEIDENIALARFANLLARYSGDEAASAMARHALGWLAAPTVALSRLTEAGVLLADREINAEPLHLTIIGAKGDATAAALYQAARALPSGYKRLDWWDRTEGPLPNPDVAYPKLARAAAFVCTEQRCSLPIFEPDAIAAFLAEP